MIVPKGNHKARSALIIVLPSVDQTQNLNGYIKKTYTCLTPPPGVGLKLFAGTHVAGTWCVPRPIRAAANQATLDSTVRRVNKHVYSYFHIFIHQFLSDIWFLVCPGQFFCFLIFSQQSAIRSVRTGAFALLRARVSARAVFTEKRVRKVTRFPGSQPSQSRISVVFLFLNQLP